MAGKRADESYSDHEAEQRATAALRHALSTPYRPQADLKLGKKTKAKKAPSKKTRPK